MRVKVSHKTDVEGLNKQCPAKKDFWYLWEKTSKMSSFCCHVKKRQASNAHMMYARSWHMYNSFPTAVLYELDCRSPARRATQSLLLSQHIESLQVSNPPVQARQSRLRCTSDSLQTGIHELFSRSLCREQILTVQLCQSSHNAHQEWSPQTLT